MYLPELKFYFKLLIVVGLLIVFSVVERRAWAAESCDPCGDSDRLTGIGNAGWDTDHPEWGPPYCAEADYPNHASTKHDIWQMNNGGTEGPEALGPLGNIKTHQLVEHWCEGPPGVGKSRIDVFWMPLVNPETIIYNRDLLAEVEERLKPAELIWLNSDSVHEWLWVQVEHFVGVEPIIPVFVDDTAGDEVTGKAYAWIRATPVEFELKVRGVTGTDGITECDLAVVMSRTGCPITFSHSSSIDASGAFTLETTIVYEVESNSGKYTGLRFSRETTSSIVVAEAMAVSAD